MEYDPQITIDELKEEAQGGFYYLASPYSHPDPEVRERRAVEVNGVSGHLMKHRLYVYSPIWASHKCALDHSLPSDHEWWMGFDRAFIDAAVGIIVAAMEGWKESKGVNYEIMLAQGLFKPIYYIRPDNRLVYRSALYTADYDYSRATSL